MSQYPSPYQPPSHQPSYYGAYPASDLLAPARRASILMFILAGLACICGVCVSAIGPMLPSAEMNAPEMAELQRMFSQFGISMQAVFIFIGLFMLVPGLVFLILAFFVRKGGSGAVITSIVFTGLAILYFAFNALIALLRAGGQGFAGVCVMVIPIALLILLMAWLIQAVRNASQLRMLEAQQQLQYWNYQQQQQYYAQQGYAPQQQQQPPPPLQQQPPPPPPPTA